MTGSLPSLSGIVERDPHDDMIVACPLVSGVDYIVTRNDDLLSLHAYESITMIAPKVFMGIMRQS